MTFDSALALAGALFVFAVVPGPGIMAITARSISSGRNPALALAVGMVMGDLVFLTAALVGASALANQLGEIFFVIKMAGAAYLVWMGVKLWSAGPVQVEPGRVQAHHRLTRNLATGLMVSLGNPKVILFYLGFLPAFVDLTRLTVADGALIVVLVTLVVGFVLIGNALLADRARRLFAHPRSARLLNRGAGTVMVGAGLAVAAD